MALSPKYKVQLCINGNGPVKTRYFIMALCHVRFNRFFGLALRRKVTQKR